MSGSIYDQYLNQRKAWPYWDREVCHIHGMKVVPYQTPHRLLVALGEYILD
jgi:hypothetical protein